MPRLRNPAVLLFLLLLSPLLHAQRAYVVPPAPDSKTPIEIRFPLDCTPGPIAATVDGFVITVRVEPSGHLCADPPFARPYGVKLPPLPPGHYRVAVGELPTVMSTTFVVRNAEPQTFDVQPFAVPVTGGLPIGISGSGRLLVPFCPDGRCTVRVGGVVVQEKRAGAEGDIFFDAPPHAPGLVDVTVSHEGRADETLVAALYYFDRFSPGDVSVFERILFPVMFDAPGANGSLWRTEAAMLNATRSFVETYNDIRPKICDAPIPPCGERLAPGEFTRWSGGMASAGVSLLVPRNDADEMMVCGIVPPCGGRFEPRSRNSFTGGDYPHGLALVAGRRDAQHLAFSLRVRDVSRETEGFGTQVPVVREAEMFRDVVTLLDVPVDTRYRVKLRIYSFDEQENGGTLVAHDYVRGTRTRTPFVLRRDCAIAAECAVTPAYAEVDLPATGVDERVNLFVEMPRGSLAWAFASVTNNATQQVTLVTPNGRGGTPCTECRSR